MLLITILFLGTLAFIYFWQDRREKAEELRFREFVIANKSKNVDDYVTALPSLKEEEVQEIDQLMDVNDISPEKLLKAINQEHEDN